MNVMSTVNEGDGTVEKGLDVDTKYPSWDTTRLNPSSCKSRPNGY